MADVRATHLRCEYLTDPLAVDAAQPRLSWVVEADRRGMLQSAYRIVAAGSEAALARDEGDLWDSGRVASDQSTQVAYSGKPLVSGQEVVWKVQVWTNHGDASGWSAPARWRMGLIEPAACKAQWIGAPGAVDESHTSAPLPATMLRREFALDRPIRRALVTVSALGLYELRVNGRRVGDHILAPEWTNYHQRVQCQVYDVTDLLRGGRNTVGAMLGEGWYAGRIGISHVTRNEWLRAWYGKRTRLMMQMEVTFDDGATQVIVTDGGWKSTTDGPIRKSCILDGEVYDARREMPGWDSPGFDDRGWQTVDVLDRLDAALVAQPNEPIRVTQELEPVAMTEPSPGVFVFDFGQNLAGWCRIRVNGPAGTTIRLRHAEVLEPDGNIYRDNLRMKPLGGDLGARQEDEYTLGGRGDEVFEPHFTYHGFRYVEVAGWPGRPALDSILARVFHSAPAMTGSFECSHALLNQLMRNIVWTQRDNMHSVPTDCPQRDERMGWMGDILVFAQPACFNMDMAAFFTKYVCDIRDAQASDGRFPDYAPHPFEPDVRMSGVPAWGDAGLVVPWCVYVNYGDRRMLERHFDAARRWVDWIHGNNPDLLWKNNRGNDYGDWLNGDTLQLEGYPKGRAEVPKEVFATAFFFHSTDLLARMAAVIGRDEEARRYGKLANDIRAAFARAYVSQDGRVEGDTQSAYALALYFDLVPEPLRPAAVEHMVRAIEAYKWHISTGFHTTIMLMSELTRNGRSDVAYRLINNRTIPSWGYTIENGATTIWERWDGYVAGRGYQDPAMNSFNHYAIGSVGEWMYRVILGINPDQTQPGYRHFVLCPRPGGELTWARGGYESIRGHIGSAWQIDGGALVMEVTIPANTTATVCVPAASSSVVSEAGRPAGDAEGVKFLRMEDGAAVFEVGSGSYRFVSERF